MLRSLYTLEDQTEDEMLKKAIVAVRQDVEAGSSVAAAMESQPGVFDPLYRSMVHAGEGSGRLEEALDRVAHQLEKLDALRRQVRSAMTYPAVVFALALVVMIVVVAFIVPVFVGIYEEIAAETPGESAELPLMTQITVGVSDFVTGKLVRAPAGDRGWRSTRFLRWKKTERGRLQWDKIKLRLPAKIGDVVQKVALARWSRTFSGTIASGVPILQAIKITGETAGNAVIQEAMDDVYDSVKRGGTIAKPLEEHDVFPPMVSHMVSVGEESGQLETMLEKIADFYEAEVDAKVKALTSLIEPIMIMFVGGDRRLHRDLDVPADLQPLRQDPLALTDRAFFRRPAGSTTMRPIVRLASSRRIGWTPALEAQQVEARGGVGIHVLELAEAGDLDLVGAARRRPSSWSWSPTCMRTTAGRRPRRRPCASAGARAARSGAGSVVVVGSWLRARRGVGGHQRGGEGRDPEHDQHHDQQAASGHRRSLGRGSAWPPVPGTACVSD